MRYMPENAPASDAPALTGRSILLMPREPYRHLLGGGPQACNDLVADLAAWVETRLRRGHRFCTWQEAYNDYLDAHAHAGRLTWTPAQCTECHGRRVNTRRPGRNLAATGHPAVCGACRGTGRGTPTAVTAQRAPAPRPGHATS